MMSYSSMPPTEQTVKDRKFKHLKMLKINDSITNHSNYHNKPLKPYNPAEEEKKS